MVKKYEEFLLEQELRLYEIGEGSRPFSYTRKGSTRVESWLGEMGTVDKSKMVEGRYESLPPLMYQFKSDKATYYVRLSAGYKKHTYIPAFSKPGALPKPWSKSWKESSGSNFKKYVSCLNWKTKKKVSRSHSQNAEGCIWNTSRNKASVFPAIGLLKSKANTSC